jgi:hypothetical protein
MSSLPHICFKTHCFVLLLLPKLPRSKQFAFRRVISLAYFDFHVAVSFVSFLPFLRPSWLLQRFFTSLRSACHYLYLEPDGSIAHPTCFVQLRFNIILPYTPRFSAYCLSGGSVSKALYYSMSSHIFATYLSESHHLNKISGVLHVLIIHYSFCRVMGFYISFRRLLYP